jgi:hypothetical protein
VFIGDVSASAFDSFSRASRTSVAYTFATPQNVGGSVVVDVAAAVSVVIVEVVRRVSLSAHDATPTAANTKRVNAGS